VKRLAIGEYSVELRDFGQVSVVETGAWNHTDDERTTETSPMVVVTVYGNDGESFTREYTTSCAGDWDSLSLAGQDPQIDRFSHELHERFENAVATALEVEQRYS
jgi:hypothetical protein